MVFRFVHAQRCEGHLICCFCYWFVCCCVLQHIGSRFIVFLQHSLRVFKGFRALGGIMAHCPTAEALNVVMGTAMATSSATMTATTTPAPLAHGRIGVCCRGLFVMGAFCVSVLFFVCLACVGGKRNPIIPGHSNEKSRVVLPLQ